MPFSGYGSTPEEVMERVIAEFFNSHFTYNLDHNGTGTPSQGRRILENWQILSQNPNYWKTHSFPNIGRLNYFISLNPELWRD